MAPKRGRHETPVLGLTELSEVALVERAGSAGEGTTPERRRSGRATRPPAKVATGVGVASLAAYLHPRPAAPGQAAATIPVEGASPASEETEVAGGRAEAPALDRGDVRGARQASPPAVARRVLETPSGQLEGPPRIIESQTLSSGEDGRAMGAVGDESGFGSSQAGVPPTMGRSPSPLLPGAPTPAAPPGARAGPSRPRPIHGVDSPALGREAGGEDLQAGLWGSANPPGGLSALLLSQGETLGEGWPRGTPQLGPASQGGTARGGDGGEDAGRSGGATPARRGGAGGGRDAGGGESPPDASLVSPLASGEPVLASQTLSQALGELASGNGFTLTGLSGLMSLPTGLDALGPSGSFALGAEGSARAGDAGDGDEREGGGGESSDGGATRAGSVPKAPNLTGINLSSLTHAQLAQLGFQTLNVNGLDVTFSGFASGGANAGGSGPGASGHLIPQPLPSFAQSGYPAHQLGSGDGGGRGADGATPPPRGLAGGGERGYGAPFGTLPGVGELGGSGGGAAAASALGVLFSPAGGGLPGYHGAADLGARASTPGSASRRGGRNTRRGPMDEMRQLVRILVRLLPQSAVYVSGGEEQGGGNRISEDQIKAYLDGVLGEAPRPTWGVPNGWYVYVAELLTWATGIPVAPDAARRCAKREPGRSWEAVESELRALGAHPRAWPIPLRLAGVRAAERHPVPLAPIGGGAGVGLGGRKTAPWGGGRRFKAAVAAAISGGVDGAAPRLHEVAAAAAAAAEEEREGGGGSGSGGGGDGEAGLEPVPRTQREVAGIAAGLPPGLSGPGGPAEAGPAAPASPAGEAAAAKRARLGNAAPAAGPGTFHLPTAEQLARLPELELWRLASAALAAVPDAAGSSGVSAAGEVARAAAEVRARLVKASGISANLAQTLFGVSDSPSLYGFGTGPHPARTTGGDAAGAAGAGAGAGAAAPQGSARAGAASTSDEGETSAAASSQRAFEAKLAIAAPKAAAALTSVFPGLPAQYLGLPGAQSLQLLRELQLYPVVSPNGQPVMAVLGAGGSQQGGLASQSLGGGRGGPGSQGAPSSQGAAVSEGNSERGRLPRSSQEARGTLIGALASQGSLPGPPG